MPSEERNIGASVRAKLLKRSRAENSDYQVLLTRYALERLLYRLGVSQFREAFVLKGALLFVTWLPDPFRPTRDLDLLGFGSDDPDLMAETFKAICSTEVPDDGVAFDVDGLTALPIRKDVEYGGVRVRSQAVIDGARIPIQVDIGFGDIITPAAVEIDYPTLLDSPAPHLRVYPVETVIAEKLNAMVTLGIANSRLKDYYDLWLISQMFSFQKPILLHAILRTFERRGSPIPSGTPTGLTDDFAKQWAVQWRAFIKRERMRGAPEELGVLIDNLRLFLVPLLSPGHGEAAHWQPSGPWETNSTGSEGL